jgi:murein DD-endopeptidase MepM/ murein hydrolase activator NlpD
MGKIGLYIIGIALLIWSCDSGNKSNNESEATDTVVQKEAVLEFGLPIDSFEVVKGKIQAGENLSTLLLPYGVSYPTIDKIAREYREIFDVRRIAADKNYTVFCTTDSSKNAKCFVYELNPYQYVVIDLRDSVNVYRGEKPIEIVEREASGIIESSLWNAMVAQDLSPALIMDLSSIYAWSIDFFHLKDGDKFKIIFEEKLVDGEFIGIGRVKAVQFHHNGEDNYAFYFEEEENYGDYFDHEGNNLRRAFLRAPLEYGRISSRYTKKRFHPVLKRWKAHLGTDYAAPHGTPILSTADGEVIAASYTSGNGNYIKIRHNSTYTTQYLHMSKFASGMKVGKRVRQGDVIGYVGSTGLATGPHVCYRFWKNGTQVDPLSEKLPPSQPVKEENRARYDALLAEMKPRLDAIPYPELSEEKESSDEVESIAMR